MFLQTPSDIGEFLYEGTLAFEQEELHSVLPGRGPGAVPSPTVGIGRPQCWDLAALLKEYGKSIPPELSLLLEEADFFLVRLACSFRPTRASWVEWARFTAYLRSKGGGPDPVVFDLHPREVHHETTTDIKIAISPSLKFSEVVEASLGTLDLGIEYKRLEPVIVGTGALKSTPGWDFSRTRRQDIRGSKFLHLIIKRAKGVEAVRTTFELQAGVRIRQGVLRASVEKDARARLTAIICD